MCMQYLYIFALQKLQLILLAVKEYRLSCTFRLVNRVFHVNSCSYHLLTLHLQPTEANIDFKMKMKNASYHFVNVDEKLMDQQNNSSDNLSEDADILRLSATEQDTSNKLSLTQLPNNISAPKYYRLDQVVFAEPINEVQTAPEESGVEDVGEIICVDNVMVKKRSGRRNRYFIEIKDGCLDCPMSNCSQSFTTKVLLKAHIRKVHCATTKCICEECGAGFKAPYLLKRHSAVHSGSKVQCSVCGKWLSERTNLSVHMSTHDAARPHACGACGRRFLRGAALRRHHKFVHRDGDIECDRCDARFTTRKLWTRHRASHAHKH